jgi:hypothetical protein
MAARAAILVELPCGDGGAVRGGSVIVSTDRRQHFE